jgi:hypothetical protein
MIRLLQKFHRMPLLLNYIHHNLVRRISFSIARLPYLPSLAAKSKLKSLTHIAAFSSKTKNFA